MYKLGADFNCFSISRCNSNMNHFFSAFIILFSTVSFSAEPSRTNNSKSGAQYFVNNSIYPGRQGITLFTRQPDSSSSSSHEEQAKLISTHVHPSQRPSGYLKFSLRDRQEARLGQLLTLMRLKRDPSIPENIRSKESQFLESRTNPQSYSFYKLSQHMSADFLNWISMQLKSFFQSSQSQRNLLVFVMGSLATGNVTFFSDFEFGVMTADFDPSTLKQAEKLVQFLKQKIEDEQMIGQGLHFDNAGLAPNVGEEPDPISNFRFLIAEPELMAMYPQASPWFKKGFLTHAPKIIKDYVEQKKRNLANPKDPIFENNYHIPTSGAYEDMRDINKNRIAHTAKAMKSIRPVFGNFELLRRFVEARNQQFSSVLEIPYEQTGQRSIKISLLDIFKSDLKYNLRNFLINRAIIRVCDQSARLGFSGSNFSRGDFPKLLLCFDGLPSINIKRHLYRPVEQTLLNLALETNLLQYDVHGIYMTNLFGILDSLQDLHFEDKNIIKNYINFLCYLRLKEQLFMREDNEEVLINPELMQAKLNLLSTQIKTAEQNIESQISESDRNLWNQELEKLKEQKSKCEKAISIVEITKEKYPSTLHKLFEDGQDKRIVRIFDEEDIKRIKTETPIVFDLLFGLYFQDEWVSSRAYYDRSSSSSYVYN